MTDDERQELKDALMTEDFRLRTKENFWETPRNLTIILAAAVGAGIGIGNLIWAHREPPPTTPIAAAPLITFPPGTVITIPAAPLPPPPASK